MATGYDWDATDTDILHSSGSPVTLSGATEQFSSLVDQDGKVDAHAQAAITFDSGAVDDVELSLYGSADGSNRDSVPLLTKRVTAAASTTKRVSFPGLGAAGLAHWAIGAKQTGATSSHQVIVSMKQATLLTS